jgi:hypothetical protein
LSLPCIFHGSSPLRMKEKFSFRFQTSRVRNRS